MDLILHLLLLGLAIFVIAELHPDVKLRGFGTAIVVAIVYSLINVLLGSILKFISFPFIFITLGLFSLVINTFLLWLTDQLIEGFELKDLTTTFVCALLITIADTILSFIF